MVWAYLCMMCTSWRQSKIGATKMLRRNWVAQCKFGSGSIASFERCRYVCFAPNYGRITRRSEPTLRAMCGRLQVGKENLHVAGLVGAAMCSAFECGSHDRWP